MNLHIYFKYSIMESTLYKNVITKSQIDIKKKKKKKYFTFSPSVVFVKRLFGRSLNSLFYKTSTTYGKRATF